MCRTLGVSPSGYYAWRNRRPSARAQENARLLKRIRCLHVEYREAYGTERLWRALRQQGESCGRHRVHRLRRAGGIQTRRRRRYIQARCLDQRAPAAPNSLAAGLFQTSPTPDQVWWPTSASCRTRQGRWHRCRYRTCWQLAASSARRRPSGPIRPWPARRCRMALARRTIRAVDE